MWCPTEMDFQNKTMIQGGAWWENETLLDPSSLAAFACFGTRSSCTPSSPEQSDYHNDADDDVDNGDGDDDHGDGGDGVHQ